MPTDIEPLFISAFEEVAPEFEFFIKRDDQTGASLTGKSRNLSIDFFYKYIYIFKIDSQLYKGTRFANLNFFLPMQSRKDAIVL